MHTPPPNPKEKGLKTATRKLPRKGPKNHQKGKMGGHHQATRSHAESFINTMKVHTRSSLPPDHPSLSKDLTMKLPS
jgi:hypothetical protein